MSDTSSVHTSFRAVLFADVVGSTALYERIGNIRAKDMVSSCLEALSRVVEQHNGRVVKSLGDGLLCAFEAKDQSVLAGLAMADEAPRHELEVRTGIHCGEVVEDGDDIFGDAVNTASRISALAKPAEILISRDMVDALPPFMRSMVRRVKPVAVKGKKEPIELYAMLTGDLSQTLSPLTITDLPVASASATLEILFGDQSFTLDPDTELTVGRDPTNGLVIASQHVSRLHARIFHRQAKFILVDHSANGTYLVPERGSKLHLMREEALLNGTGAIFPGADPDTTESEPLRYRLR
jgi:class 3 adenylate cyclase